MIQLADIERAADLLRGQAVRTPLVPVKYAGRDDLLLKCENLQLGGAFKFRGAYTKIASVRPQAVQGGIVTYSSGNHAQGVALAATRLGVRATVVMLDQSLPVKVQQTRRFGAEVIFGGTSSEAIRRRAEEIAAERDAVLVPPFDDPQIMAGQGTVGLEIAQERPDVAAVVVPIGGGGLISGIAIAITQLCPGAKVFGVEPQGAPKVRRSLDAGQPVTLPSTDTLADGLKPLRPGDLTFEVIRRRVEDVVLVTDEEILETTRYLILEEKVLAEPSGAAALAAVRHGRLRLPSGPVVCVVSGGNADLAAILAEPGPCANHGR